MARTRTRWLTPTETPNPTQAPWLPMPRLTPAPRTGRALRPLSLVLCSALFASALSGACGRGGKAPEPAAPESAAPAPVPKQAPAPIVHRHASGVGGIFANAYLVEGPTSVIAVDATLSVSEARALRAELDELGKPLIAVLLTHGHPDHYNGASELTRGLEVPVLATRAVDAIIRRDDAAKEKQWKSTFGAEWPTPRRFPDRIVESGVALSLDGIELTPIDLGPGESHADSIWLMGPDRAFVGDLIFNGVHSYTADGHTGAWLRHLDRLDRDLAAIQLFYPGHGEPGGRDLLAAQRAYLTTYRDSVRELAAGAPRLTDPAKAELTRRMKATLPTDKLEFLIPLGADPVAAELATR